MIKNFKLIRIFWFLRYCWGRNNPLTVDRVRSGIDRRVDLLCVMRHVTNYQAIRSRKDSLGRILLNQLSTELGLENWSNTTWIAELKIVLFGKGYKRKNYKRSIISISKTTSKKALRKVVNIGMKDYSKKAVNLS